VAAGLQPADSASAGCKPAATGKRSSTVGLPARIDQLVLPGPELEVKPLAARTPIVLRIVHVAPHGSAFRYDLEYCGLEPGTFDLANYLRRKDRSAATDLPPLPVTIKSLLPPGQVKPHELEPQPGPHLGGYRLALIIGGVLWLLGFLAILLVGRPRKKAIHQTARPVTLADRLRPLIEDAVAGKVEASRLAELERTLIVYWERRLQLSDRKPAEVLAVLRLHAEAGPLLRQLEVWLHRPGAATIDVASLLAPYRDLPADGLDVEAPFR